MSRNATSFDRSFFVHLTLITLGTAGAFAVVTSAAIFAPVVLKLEAGATSLDEVKALTEKILRLHATVWPVVLTSLIAVCASSLFLYTRMTAPLVRFVGVFRSVRDGQFPEPLQVRAGDYLRREGEALNEMTRSLSSRIGEVQHRHADLEEVLGEISEHRARGGADDLAELLGRLEERSKALGEALAHFSKVG